MILARPWHKDLELWRFSKSRMRLSSCPAGGITLSLILVRLVQIDVFRQSHRYRPPLFADFTVAVTQNFCSRTNFEYVWLRTRDSRPRFAQKLRRQLQKIAATNSPNAPVYGSLVEKIEALACVPSVPPDSSSSSSSSSSSDSEDDGTVSESTDAEGRCMCSKCKRRRKRRVAGQGGEETSRALDK